MTSNHTNEHVLITGGAGFIGSRLAARFVRDGHTVTVLDSLLEQVHGAYPEKTSSLLQSLDGVADVLVGSVTSSDSLDKALDGATIVVHLAAETGTGQSMYEVDRYVEVNVGGTARLLEAMARQKSPARRLVVASSRSIYGEGSYQTEDGRVVHPPHRDESNMSAGDFDVHISGELGLKSIPTDESAKLHPSSVYGITKHTQESLIMTVAPTIGVEPVSLRYQNVYGPGQSLKNPYTGILSIFSNLIRQGKPINIFEDGHESRDFVYIDDVVEATFLAATTQRAAGEILNVGSGVGTTVIDVVNALMSEFQITVPAIVTGNYRIGDIRHNVADLTRIREVLGFVPTTTFAEGVAQFAEWVVTEPIETQGYEQSLKEMTSRNLLK